MINKKLGRFPLPFPNQQMYAFPNQQMYEEKKGSMIIHFLTPEQSQPRNQAEVYQDGWRVLRLSANLEDARKRSEKLQMETNGIVNDDNRKHKTRRNAQESEPPAMICSRKRMRTGNTTRRWDDLHQSVLLQIFDRVPVEDLMLRVSTVCGSWFSAVVNILFPPTTVLDLRNADTFNWDNHDLGLSYLYFLQIVLDTRPDSQWTTLYTPCKHIFNEDVITYIAQRTPCLRVLFLSMKATKDYMHEYKHLGKYMNVLPYWKNLRELTGFFNLVPDFVGLANEVGIHCKEIRSLNLTGNFGYKQGVAIAKNFPRLEHLHFPDTAVVSMEALLIILDGCKDLVTLDLRHSIFEILCLQPDGKAKELTRKVCEKVTRVKNYLRCEGKLCSLCGCFWKGVVAAGSQV